MDKGVPIQSRNCTFTLHPVCDSAARRSKQHWNIPHTYTFTPLPLLLQRSLSSWFKKHGHGSHQIQKRLLKKGKLCWDFCAATQQSDIQASPTVSEVTAPVSCRMGRLAVEDGAWLCTRLNRLLILFFFNIYFVWFYAAKKSLQLQMNWRISMCAAGAQKRNYRFLFNGVSNILHQYFALCRHADLQGVF